MVFSAGYTTKSGGSGIGLHSAANFIIQRRRKHSSAQRRTRRRLPPSEVTLPDLGSAAESHFQTEVE